MKAEDLSFFPPKSISLRKDQVCIPLSCDGEDYFQFLIYCDILILILLIYNCVDIKLQATLLEFI